MEAKFIKDILNEKFTEKSDPITDMGIGSFASLKKGDIIECTKFVQASAVWYPGGKPHPSGRFRGETLYSKPQSNWLGNMFEPGEKYRLLSDAVLRDDGKIEIRAINVKHGNGNDRLVATPKQFANRFKIIK